MPIRDGEFVVEGVDITRLRPELRDLLEDIEGAFYARLERPDDPARMDLLFRRALASLVVQFTRDDDRFNQDLRKSMGRGRAGRPPSRANPHVARTRLMEWVDLLAGGRSEREVEDFMAAKYGVEPKTVREWLAEATAMQLARQRKIPER